MKQYDVIVIGGGHNGLTTATLLAKRSKKVLLLEKRKIIGGLAAREEFAPGYRCTGLLHDTGAVRTELIKELGLTAHGLRFQATPPSVTILSDDGRSVTLTDDAESIRKVSAEDAAAYREYRSFVSTIAPLLRKLLNAPPPDFRAMQFADLRSILGAGLGLRRLGADTMYELLKVLPMSVADFLNERFRIDFIKAGIGFPGIFGSFNGPWSSYTTMNLLLHEATSGISIEGGPAALVDALTKAATAAGVEIRTAAPVRRVLLDANGMVAGVELGDGSSVRAGTIASSVSPRSLFLDLFAPADLPPSLETEVLHYRSRGTVASLRLALNRRIRWKCNPDKPILHARTGNSFNQMEQAFDAVKYREFSGKPALVIHVPTSATTGLAPDGHDVVSVLSHFAPYEPDGGWTAEKRLELERTILAVLEEQTTGLKDSIVSAELLTPADMETRYGLSAGNLFHGEEAIDQLIGRPVPSCAGYRTPIKGLFLCGSGSHPGGGITGAPGALAAGVIAKEIR